VTQIRPPHVFDGHNDLLSRLVREGGLRALDTVETGRGGHVDLPKARAGGLSGGFFAVFVPSPGKAGLAFEDMGGESYDLPLAEPLAQHDALLRSLEQIALLQRLEQRGWLRICRTVPQIRDCMDTGVLAAVLHMEGAEAIDPDLLILDVLHGVGLRSLGPVWSRQTRFAHGVPFRYPSDAEIGPGLTEDGVRLVRRCNDLGILIDLSHLNAAGLRDVAGISRAPLVATHSNAHAICPHARNLTDDQLRLIAQSGGLVGLNFAAGFLRPDGQMNPDVPFETLLRHLDHLLGLLGEGGVALGSDFDGAVIPRAIGSAAGLADLAARLVQHYGPALASRITHENWLDLLDRTWITPGPSER